MIDSQTANAVGFIGGVTVLSAYAWQTLRNDPANAALYALNCIGASLLALSLVVNYNLPALALEIIWAAIAFSGLVRRLSTRR